MPGNSASSLLASARSSRPPPPMLAVFRATQQDGDTIDGESTIEGDSGGVETDD
jgi:hypothetical protein